MGLRSANLLALCDELGPANPVVVGHSLGGGIALRAALNEPNRFAGLILAAPVSTTGLDFLPDRQFVTLSHRPGLGRRAHDFPGE